MTIGDGAAAGVLAWLMSYAIHSTILLAGAWAFTRFRSVQPVTADIIWKSALLGGIFTATLQTQFDVRPAGSIALFATPVTQPDGGPNAIVPGGAESRREANLVRTDEPAATATLRSPESVAAPAAMSPSSIVVIGWAVLAVLLAVPYAARRLILVGRLGDRQPLAENGLRAELTALCRAAGINRRVQLTASRTISSPIALGLSEICLPQAAITDLDPEQQRSMLAHELAHLIRRDPLWLNIGSIMERVFFFQPLNRMARRQMQANAEYLCDDWAARHAGSGLPLARCLAKVAEWIQASPLGVPVAGMAEQRSLLVSRISRLIDDRAMATPRSRRTVAILASAVLVAMVIVAPRVSGRTATQLSPVDTARDAGEPQPGANIGQFTGDPDQSPDEIDDIAQRNRPVGIANGTEREDTVVVNALIARLKDEDAQVRRAAANSLGRLKDPRAVSALIAVFRDDDAEVRAAAVDAVGSFEDPRTIPALAERLSDGATDVRHNALSALSSFEKGVPAAPVIRLLDDADADVRHQAAHLLARIGDRSAVAPLTRLTRDQSADVRAAAVEALAEMGDPAVGPAIVAALSDAHADVRQQGLHGVEQLKLPIDDATVLKLLADSDVGVRSSAAQLAGERSIVATIPALKRMLADPSSDVRECAVDALSEIVHPSARAALRSALDSDDPKVRRRAAEALGDREQ